MKLLAGGVLFGIAAVSGAQISKFGNGYLLRTKYTQGQKSTYLVEMRNSVSGPKNVVTTTMTQTVKSIKGGVTTLVLTTAPAKMNGKAVPGANNMPGTVTAQVDKRGKPIAGGSSLPSSSVMFPDTPINIGGSWKAKTEIPSTGLGAGVVNATYTLKKITVYKGRPAAMVGIKLQTKEPLTISGTGTAYFALSDGSQLDSNVAMTVSMGANSPGAKPMKVTATIRVSRKN